MASTAPSSLFRPAILFFTGAAAACTAYLVYSSLRPSRSNGLRRSNAVRRPLRPRDPPAHVVSSGTQPHAHDPHFLGEYNFLGVSIPLNPHNLVTTDDLREAVAHTNPSAQEDAISAAITDFYEVFLDRLLALVFPGRPLSAADIAAVQQWSEERVPDYAAAVIRAAERHAETFPLGDVIAIDGAASIAATEHSWRSDDDTDGGPIDRDGQTLQRTLYHIAEDRAKREGVIHRGITCNGCDEKPIRGIRWHCANCDDFDLCSNCEATNSHYKTHIFYKIRVPAPHLALPKWDSLYPGQPHLMPSSIHFDTRRRLVNQTKMEAEELEGLWDQFTCLAGTPWEEGDDLTGRYAIDRRAFNHAFVPRYKDFMAAPNLVYDRVFAYYDTDKNGLIGFDEWVQGVKGMHTTDVETKAKIVFNGYDIDGDGFISRKDVLRIFRAFYAIEKEATRNYLADLPGDMPARIPLDTIHSSQPLSSAFPLNETTTGLNTINPRLYEKVENEGENDSPVLLDKEDTADRDDILRVTDLRNILPGHNIPPSEQDRIISERWERREFYIDQEEGLSRPEGTIDVDVAGGVPTDETEQSNSANNATSESERPRWSRSSSRVRFQDDVDVETRSNASTSSRPVGERWGGYEVPEFEKDLGKEVLYQITQQSFNELLNPLFQEKEDMAMDANATRNDRQKHATAISEIIKNAKTEETDIIAIYQEGIFRFSTGVVEHFCQMLNSGAEHATFRAIFENDDGTEVTREEARARLAKIYEFSERQIIDTIKVRSSKKPNKMTLWNFSLCRHQLKNESLNAVLDCVSYLEWIPYPPMAVNQMQSTPLFRDPTMPQFRPHSRADIDPACTSPGQSTNTFDESREADESSTSETEEVGGYRIGGFRNLTSNPHGLLFVFPVPEIELAVPDDQNKEAEEEGTPRPEPSPPDVSTVSASESPAVDQPASSSVVPEQEGSNVDDSILKWLTYADDPFVHLLYVDSSSGVDVVRVSSRRATHSLNPYQIVKDQVAPLIRHIRQLALYPCSELYLTMLASLETAAQEISDRKGSGLINLEEFSVHMRSGGQPFLESWMDWVSV